LLHIHNLPLSSFLLYPLYRFFAYQIANVYLILLAGSMFGALADVINDPMSIVSLLAASLPGVSTFFSTS